MSGADGFLDITGGERGIDPVLWSFDYRQWKTTRFARAIPGQIDSQRTCPAIALEGSATPEAIIWTPFCDARQASFSTAAVCGRPDVKAGAGEETCDAPPPHRGKEALEFADHC